MATPRRKPVDPGTDDFLGTSNIVPGEVLVTLAPAAAAEMTASVPTHPAGPVLGMAAEFGVSDLDAVLADLGAHDITRLAVPGPTDSYTDVLGETVPADEEHALGRTFRVRIDADADVPAAVAKLTKVGTVEVAEPNRYRVTQVVPNDPRYAEQWGLAKINAPAAWDRTTGSAAVVVAVIDTGIDRFHPDLAPLLVPGFDMVDLGPHPTPPAGFRFEGDFAGRDGDPVDEVGHGTHVAGTIAAASDNGLGVAGVTWQCRIQPIKALTRMVRISDGQVRGVGTAADIAAATRWAADNGASVINMSLGSSAPTAVERDAIAYALGRGVVVVAAMGNDGTANPSYPAAYDGVVSVGATDSTDARATFSQTGAHIDVVAPGVAVLSTVPGGYGTMSGTSMATPHVAGVAALIRSAKPSATVAEVTEVLRATARPLGGSAPNNAFGWGLVDAAAAVARVLPPLVVKTTAAICGEIPRTVEPGKCQVRTVLLDTCMPRTVVTCPPRTVACPPRTVTCARTVVCPTPRTVACREPITVTIPVRPAGHDPYGYLGDARPDAAASAWEAGYEAGYLAALAAVQADDDPYGQGPFEG